MFEECENEAFFLCIVSACLLILAVPAVAVSSGIPQTLNYQGFLMNGSGQPLSGAQSVTFKLYDVNTGSSPLYTEAQTVSVANGVFNAQIGAVTPITLAFDVPYWLEISVGATVLSPRQPLAAGAYALRAKAADSATTAASTDALSSSALTQYGIISGLPGRANTVSTVDSTGDVGLYSSITLGADNLPIIAYYDNTNGDLKVAKCVNAACSGSSVVSTVDSTGNVGLSPSITLGADGLPVIAYFESTIRRLKVAKCVNAACSGTSTVTAVAPAGDTGVSASPSIALGPDGLPVISYYYANQLKVAKCVNTACTGTSTLSNVESGPNFGLNSSIMIGTDGFPRIAYNAPNFGLKISHVAR